MSTDRDTTRIVRSWLDEGATVLPDRVLDAVLDQVPATSQRRPLWPAWRFRHMNSALKLGLAATAVVVVALVGITLLPRNGGVGASGTSPTSAPTASPTPTPTQTVTPTPPASPAVLTEFPHGPLTAGAYTVAPFGSPDTNVCPDEPSPLCIEPDEGDSVRFTVTVPARWEGLGANWIFAPTEGGTADLLLDRGAWLLADPCQTTPADIPVGPTVADFVDAIAAHPILDTTAPVDVTLAGYSGKYLELQGPAVMSTESSPDPKCPVYRPWDHSIYMQGPSHRWRLWVLDVDGARVVIQGMDYPGTPEATRAELQAMIDTIRIEP